MIPLELPFSSHLKRCISFLSFPSEYQKHAFIARNYADNIFQFYSILSRFDDTGNHDDTQIDTYGVCTILMQHTHYRKSFASFFFHFHNSFRNY